MMRRSFAAAAIFLLFASPSLAVEPAMEGRHGPGQHFLAPQYFKSAKPARGYSKHVRKEKTKARWDVLQAKSIPQTHERVAEAIAKPIRYVGGRLVCALNVGLALQDRGQSGTGSRLAKSYLSWGRPSGPVPGAVAVWNRGRNPQSGHAAIVAYVKNGVVYYWNPSSRGRGWVLVAIRKTPIAYRVAA